MEWLCYRVSGKKLITKHLRGLVAFEHIFLLFLYCLLVGSSWTLFRVVLCGNLAFDTVRGIPLMHLEKFMQSTCLLHCTAAKLIERNLFVFCFVLPKGFNLV